MDFGNVGHILQVLVNDVLLAMILGFIVAFAWSILALLKIGQLIIRLWRD